MAVVYVIYGAGATGLDKTIMNLCYLFARFPEATLAVG